MERISSTKKKTWLLLVLFMIMAITICKECESTTPEFTYSVAYFTIPTHYESLLLKVDNTVAGDQIYVIAIMNMEDDTSYAKGGVDLSLDVPTNFSFVSGDQVQSSPYLPNGSQWVAIWEIIVPDVSGNYTLNVSTVGSQESKTIEVVDMPDKTTSWLENNSESLLAAGILITILIFASIFAYLFVNLGGKKDEV